MLARDAIRRACGASRRASGFSAPPQCNARVERKPSGVASCLQSGATLSRRRTANHLRRRTIVRPVRGVYLADSRRSALVPEAGNRYLRVVLLADGETVHNAFFDPQVRAMRIRYFEATDTLFIEFRDTPVAETRDLMRTPTRRRREWDYCAITIEHASQRAGIPKFSSEQVAA